MTDESVFEVGRNVATTEGAVVFENELFQLLEYKPLTAKVYERPFLLVPPCINKFYILDLQPENSLIRYAVEPGPSHLRGELAQPRCVAGGQDLGRLRRGRRHRGHPRGPADLGRRANQCPGLLRRRHDPEQRAGRAGCARARARGQRHLPDHADRLHRHRHPRRLHRRGLGALSRNADGPGRPAAGQGPGLHVQLPAPQRPGLELRGGQLPQGRDAAAVRPAVLEQRQHQPARAVLCLVPAQHLPGKQARPARQAHRVRRKDRPGAARRCRSTSMARARTTSCPSVPPMPPPRCCRARSAS